MTTKKKFDDFSRGVQLAIITLTMSEDEKFLMKHGEDIDIRITVNGVEADFEKIIERFMKYYNDDVKTSAEKVFSDKVNFRIQQVIGKLTSAESAIDEFQRKIFEEIDWDVKDWS